MAKSFPAAPAAHHAPVLSQGRTATSVRAWLDSCSRHQPLSERTVLELARRIHRWQQHPGGPDHAPEPVRRKALRARDQLVRHNLRLISHTWGRHRSSLPAEDEGTADAFQEAAIGQLIDRLKNALEDFEGIQSIVVAGGVAANKIFRARLAEQTRLEVRFAPTSLCSDNATMIALHAFVPGMNLNSPHPFSRYEHH
jgi:hypothetical protein